MYLLLYESISMSYVIFYFILQVELSRVAGSFPVDRISEAASDSSRDSRYEDDPPDPSTQQVL